MTLPALIDYATPRHTPTNRVNWTLDPSRAAVLVHDLQRYFFRAFAPGCPALERALAATAEILAAARAAGVPVFYTAQTGDQSTDERGLQGELWGRGMTSAPEDTAIVDAVAPHAGDAVIVKHRYSAFAKSDLAERLAALGRDQLVVVGVYAHIGVAATACDAFQREVYPCATSSPAARPSHPTWSRAPRAGSACRRSTSTGRRRPPSTSRSGTAYPARTSCPSAGRCGTRPATSSTETSGWFRSARSASCGSAASSWPTATSAGPT